MPRRKTVVTRAAAKAAGLTRYCTGHPCRRGHLDERWVSSRTCVSCFRHKRKRPSNITKWRKLNPAKAAMHQSVSNARARCRRYGLADPVPRGLDYSTLLPVFREYVRRRDTGEAVEVHHKVPLQLGGLVTRKNLAVIPAYSHRAISARDMRFIITMNRLRKARHR